MRRWVLFGANVFVIAVGVFTLTSFGGDYLHRRGTELQHGERLPAIQGSRSTIADTRS